MTVTVTELHDHLAALKGAELGYPFGPEVAVYKLRGKVFAMLAGAEHAGRVTLKTDPVLAEVLREAYPAVRPGYHTNKRLWNTVYLDVPLPDEVLWNMVQASYELVRASLPKRIQAELDAEG